jgi:hypothetical protein
MGVHAMRPDHKERNATIARRVAAGGAPKVIAADYGITDEWVRQIAKAHPNVPTDQPVDEPADTAPVSGTTL